MENDDEGEGTNSGFKAPNRPSNVDKTPAGIKKKAGTDSSVDALFDALQSAKKKASDQREEGETHEGSRRKRRFSVSSDSESAASLRKVIVLAAAFSIMVLGSLATLNYLERKTESVQSPPERSTSAPGSGFSTNPRQSPPPTAGNPAGNVSRGFGTGSPQKRDNRFSRPSRTTSPPPTRSAVRIPKRDRPPPSAISRPSEKSPEEREREAREKEEKRERAERDELFKDPELIDEVLEDEENEELDEEEEEEDFDIDPDEEDEEEDDEEDEEEEEE